MRPHHDLVHRPARPADLDDMPGAGPMDGSTDGIDLERALWDMEYRRQVLEILRRDRRGEGQPPAPPPPETKT